MRKCISISRIFDKDGEDDIDFMEFIIGCYEWKDLSMEKKLEFLFDMFDTDKTGLISLADILKVIGTLYINEGLDKNSAVQRSEKIVSIFTYDRDAEITREHFVARLMEQRDLMGEM